MRFLGQTLQWDVKFVCEFVCEIEYEFCKNQDTSL